MATDADPTRPPANAPITLWGNPVSGNSYKVALMLALTGLPYTYRNVDLAGGGNLKAEFLAVNPQGKVPVLQYGSLAIRQSTESLLYLAQISGRFGAKTLEEQVRTGEWFGFQTDFGAFGIARLRFIRKFTAGDDKLYEYFKPTALRGLGIIDAHLKANDWLVGGRPTVADINAYPTQSVLEDTGLDIGQWPSVLAWRQRVRALPGFAEAAALMRA
ncbi:MAG: glutathione S-transferase family protein [Alphaproteobacteria bacterium]|nr:glutathione S-transferase family protein [Alphaproteobacteria bacterium]